MLHHNNYDYERLYCHPVFPVKKITNFLSMGPVPSWLSSTTFAIDDAKKKEKM